MTESENTNRPTDAQYKKIFFELLGRNPHLADFRLAELGGVLLNMLQRG